MHIRILSGLNHIKSIDYNSYISCSVIFFSHLICLSSFVEYINTRMSKCIKKFVINPIHNCTILLFGFIFDMKYCNPTFHFY